MQTPIISLVIALIVALVVSFAVGLWQAPSDSDPASRSVARSSQDTDKDITELYARSDYQSCVSDGTTLLADAEDDELVAYRDYITENTTWDQYQQEFGTYEEKLADYHDALNACWDTYQAETSY